MQRGAGNRAVGRALQRRKISVAGRPRSGLRLARPTASFARAAFDFWHNPKNADASLSAFALHLVAEGNARLRRLGIPTIDALPSTEASFAAALFSTEFWSVELMTLAFTARGGVDTVGELNAQEAAVVAGRVYHELRHAEQMFRVARVIAARSDSSTVADIADGIRSGMQLDPDVALAAARKPLSADSQDAANLAETQAWFENSEGTHEVYQRAVVYWLESVTNARTVMESVTAQNFDSTIARAGGIIDSWFAKDKYVDFLDEHIRTIMLRRISREDQRILAHLQNIAVAASELKQARADTDPTFFSWEQLALRVRPINVGLGRLHRALYAAYADQPVERDAEQAGAAVAASFRKLAAATGGGRDTPPIDAR